MTERAKKPLEETPEYSQGVYRLSEAERAGIERGLADLHARRFASDEQIAAIFRKALSTRP
jgi:hypothetical protein